MYEAGQPEIDAIAKVIRSKRLFRYMEDSQCARFENRYAKYVGVKHAHMTSSGTEALTAALTGLGIGPGDEVIVPVHTYMATAVAVLAVGAIPVIVDIDASITMDADAFADAIGPRTRAVIPVHMWGLSCDMTSIMRIARKRKLLVLEDACQAVGGGYEGKMLGSIGHAGAFSFNYFKNMTCGEGGCVVTNDEKVHQRAKCRVDCCGFYWTGKRGDVVPFIASGARGSEIEGAMMNAQLDRLPSMIRKMRRQKKHILRATADLPGLVANPCHSLDWECGSHVMYLLPSPEHADQFAQLSGGGVTGKTGRHNSTEWDPILKHQASLHPQLDPFKLPANRKCRKNYDPRNWERSMGILNRTVKVGTLPQRTDKQVQSVIKRISCAAKTVLAA